MKIIKAARVYKAKLPLAADLRGHLEEMTFLEIKANQYSHGGFVPAPGAPDADLVTVLSRGYAFAFRFDEKIIPAASVKAEVTKRAQAIEDAEGYKPGRKALRELRDIVFEEMVLVALHKTTVVPAFYDPEANYLVVCTVSQKLADLVMSSLVKVVGSIETSTIHIAELKNGLTTKLRDHIYTSENQFGDFELAGSFWLKRDSEKVVIESATSEEDNGALREALETMLQVEAIRLQHHVTTFKLSSDFIFRGITFAEPEEETTYENMADAWMDEAALQLLNFTAAVQSLCDLMGYAPPEPAFEE